MYDSEFVRIVLRLKLGISNLNNYFIADAHNTRVNFVVAKVLITSPQHNRVGCLQSFGFRCKQKSQSGYLSSAEDDRSVSPSPPEKKTKRVS